MAASSLPEPSRADIEQAVVAFERELAGRDYSTPEWLLATADPDQPTRLHALQTTIANSATGRRLRRSRRVARRLVELLADGSARIRFAATLALWEVRAAEALPALQRLVGADDWHQRCVAARAIGSQGGARAVEILRAALAQETEPQAVSWYARALGQTGETDVVPDLLELAGHADWDVRWAAVQALDELRHPSAAHLVDRLAANLATPEEEQAYLQRWRRRLARRAATARRKQSAADSTTRTLPGS